jgi:energy-coupling factor transport system permease protein
MKLRENVMEYLTIENIKLEIMRTAYGNPESILANMDSRVLIVWYLIFSLVPWFFYEVPVLLGLFFLTAIFTYFCKVSPLIIWLLGIGFVTQNVTVTFVSLIFGGNIDVFLSMFVVSLKLTTLSLATICIFTSMDPEKLSDALVKLGMPAKFGFGISYGYRMLPILIDEYNSIFNSFRLRGKKPNEKKFFGLNIFIYYIGILMKAFYPMILNTAKRVKSTVEALETKGFTESMSNKKVKKLKLSYMKISKKDYIFTIIATSAVVLIVYIGRII